MRAAVRAGYVVSAADWPTPAQCAPVTALALEILSDLRSWSARHPGIRAVPVEAMAMAEAATSPWRPAAELRLAARLDLWTYALDDHVEQRITGLGELDDLFARCNAVLSTGEPDDTHPLLAAFSDLRAELDREPGFAALSGLWAPKFADCLAGMRYDWLAGQPGGLDRTDAARYLDHADSVLIWIVHPPRWVTHPPPPQHLDTLTAALDEIAVIIRLANDLATYHWEREQPGQNNILMYGVSREWVLAELARRTGLVHDRLAPLLPDVNAAAELVRLMEWAVAFYARADFRGWGSDVPATADR